MFSDRFTAFLGFTGLRFHAAFWSSSSEIYTSSGVWFSSADWAVWSYRLPSRLYNDLACLETIIDLFGMDRFLIQAAPQLFDEDVVPRRSGLSEGWSQKGRWRPPPPIEMRTPASSASWSKPTLWSAPLDPLPRSDVTIGFMIYSGPCWASRPQHRSRHVLC